MPTVVIADDNARSRAALRTLVETNVPWQVCGEATNGVEALEIARRSKPDLVLLDLMLPITNGVEAASAIRSVLPKKRVAIVTMFPELLGKSMAKMAGIDLIIDKTKCVPGLMSALKEFAENTQPASDHALSE